MVRYGTEWFSVFRTSKKMSYRNSVPHQNTVRNSTVRNFFRTVIPYLSVLINLLKICSYAIANERFYNKIILFSPQKIGALIQLFTV